MKNTLITIIILSLIAVSCKQTTIKQQINNTIETHQENNVSDNSNILQTDIADDEKYFTKNTMNYEKVKDLFSVDSIDISKLLWKEIEFLGMIGDDIQRMGIVFLSTTRISINEYEIIGKSKVKNNICDFEGIIEAERVIETDIERDEIPELSTVDGRIIGKYHFIEDKNQSGTGIFEGIFEIYWAYYDDDKIGLADFWYTMSDYTIIFTGSWKSYQTGNSKNACWSDYQGCFPAGFRSDGPDIIPDEKYRSSGWGSLTDLWSFDEEKEKNAAKYERENWYHWWK